MSDTPEPQRSTPLAALSLIIGIAALIAFVLLNRMMAPPFPKFATYPSSSNTNSPAQALTNSASSTNK